MKIEDAGELRSFEPMPTEAIHYVSVVRYPGSFWAAGPFSDRKEAVIESLKHWNGVTEARIYTVRLPIGLRGEK